MSDDLSNWQRKREFYAHAPEWVRQIWPTEPSFNWYVKSRRQVLSNAGMLRPFWAHLSYRPQFISHQPHVTQRK